MSSQQDLPPVPYKTPIQEQGGFLTPPWAAWFRQLFNRVGGNQNNTPAGYADDAAASAAAAASSASAAAASSASALTRAGNAAASASTATAEAGIATVAANAAAASASDAESAVAAAVSLIDLLGVQAYSPDYITDTVNVPIHRQLIAFQRITIAIGGSLQIYGRGRIL